MRAFLIAAALAAELTICHYADLASAKGCLKTPRSEPCRPFCPVITGVRIGRWPRRRTPRGQQARPGVDSGTASRDELTEALGEAQ
jgi:hypothetical protein